MSLRKQLEYNKVLFMYRVLNNEAPEYISNLYKHTPSRYSNSRNYKLSLPRPRIDVFRTSIPFAGAFLWNNLPLTDLVSRSAPSSENFVHTLKQLHKMDCDIILLGREKETVRFSSDCHCSDWSFETYFIHPYNSAQSFRLLVRVIFPPPPCCSL